MIVGFDSKLITLKLREPQIKPPNGVRLEHYEPIPEKLKYKKGFKFLLGAAVTTADKDDFSDVYCRSLESAFRASGFEPRNPIYDSMMLVSETGYQMLEIIPRLLTLLCNNIERIDLYNAYYTRHMIVYGDGRSESLLPIQYLNLINNSFPHICASKYYRTTKRKEDVYELDNFKLGKTPAWENLITSSCDLNLYYSGGLCNPLISTCDLIVRLIEERLQGDVSDVNLKKALIAGCNILSKKIHCWPLGFRSEEMRYSTPRLNIPAITRPFIKHPILFTVGKWPDQFVTTDVFINMQKKMLEKQGCIKKYEPKDHVLMDDKLDKILILDESKRNKIKRQKDFGLKLPSLLSLRDFL